MSDGGTNGGGSGGGVFLGVLAGAEAASRLGIEPLGLGLEAAPR